MGIYVAISQILLRARENLHLLNGAGPESAMFCHPLEWANRITYPTAFEVGKPTQNVITRVHVVFSKYTEE
jgi:hypothetical protein